MLGAKGIFERSMPDCVLFEINHRRGNISDEPSIRLLRRFGYKFLSIPKSYLRMRILWFDPDKDSLQGP